MDSIEAMVMQAIESSKSAHKRIDTIETEQKDQRNLILSVRDMATEIKHMREDVSNVDKRISELEKKPEKRLEQIIGIIITRYWNCNTGFFIWKNWNVGRQKYGYDQRR